MMVTTEQREAAREATRKKAIRASSKQDADKLIKGFEELDETAARRGVWELTQNACDLANECEITLDFRNGEFSFSHNGEPFTSETLIFLIKQVSSKNPEEELVTPSGVTRERVGRFGTGFITTHAYGRDLRVSGSMEVDGVAAFIDLVDFPIDRSENSPEGLLTSITEQQMLVDELLAKAEYRTTAADLTTFKYVPVSEAERTSVGQAWSSAVVNVPYVMALNEVLQRVRLIDEQGNERVYQKGIAEEVEGVWYVPISCNNEVLTLTCLCKPYGHTQVIAPVGRDNRAVPIENDLPRLFLYFPLIGSESWGCDFVIHSDRFAPKNARDGVHLTLKNDAVRTKAEHNRQLLREVSAEVFGFLEKRAEHLEEPVRLARASFATGGEAEDVEFRQELQALWQEQLAGLKLVETASQRRTVNECRFLSREMLADIEALPAIQAVAERLWPSQLPKAALAEQWAQVLEEWASEKTNWITPQKLAEAIGASESGLAAFDAETLLALYQYWRAQGQEALFDRFALLPSRIGAFERQSSLKQAQDLVPRFIDVLEKVVPSALGELVDERFEALQTLIPYTRRDLATQVDGVIQAQMTGESKTLTPSARKGLLLLCGIFSGEGASVSNGLRWQLLPFVHEFYGESYEKLIISKVSEKDEIDYEAAPLRNLVKQFLADLGAAYELAPEEQRPARLPFMQSCLKLLVGNKEMQSGVLNTAVVFPNQLGDLCAVTDLQVAKQFGPQGNQHAKYTEQLKDWAKRILKRDCRIELAHPDFEGLVLDMGRPEQDGKDLARRLETVMEDRERMDYINTHPNQKEILEIIEEMPHGWEAYFPRINGQKAEIMLRKVSDGQQKDNLFKIIRLKDEQIRQLGELAGAENLSELLNKAQDLLAQQQNKQADFAFKKMIGVGIEDLVRATMQEQMAAVRVEVLEQQNGQDIVVKIGEAVGYRIEVKSRWQSGYSTTLSYRQLTTALENPERYALCSVNLTDYWPAGEDRRHEIKDIRQIAKYIKFVTDIGHQIAPLAGMLKQAERDADAVRLADEFRVVVPQRIIAQGKSFDEFVTYLTALLRESKAI
jgi:hypothetical protein